MSSNKGPVLLRSSFAFPSALATVLHKLFSSLTHTETHIVRGVRGQTERRGIPDKPVAWRRAQREEWQLCRAFTTLCGVTKQSLPFSRLSKTPLWCEEKAFISHTHSTHAPYTIVCTCTHTQIHRHTLLNKQNLLNTVLNLLCTNLFTDTLSLTVAGVVLAPSSLYFTGQKNAAERPAISACNTQ